MLQKPRRRVPPEKNGAPIWMKRRERNRFHSCHRFAAMLYFPLERRFQGGSKKKRGGYGASIRRVQRGELSGMETIKRIGILTSGGDSPGMNAAVVSVARCAAQKGLQLMGIKRGYNGLLGLSDNPEDDIEYLDPETVLDIMDMRGTYLRTARCLPFLQPEVRKKAAEDLLRQGIQALVVIGGDGSYHGALELCKLGVPCIGIPGTIDNDLSYTEATLGYDTAVNVCVDAVRSIRATSRSHDRPAVVQVMGRNCGDIAMRTTIATGAEMVIVPERALLA
jgi:6-phosphofructokinase 1